MKRNLLTLLFALCLGNIVAWAQRPADNPAHIATEVAADNPPIRLGYCNTAFNPYYTRYFYEQTDQPHEFGAAIYLSPEYLAKYKGDKISSIHFALWEEAGEHYTVFVTRDLGFPSAPLQPLSHATVTRGNFHTGWNAVSIDPVTITGNEGLYVGWLSAVSKEEAMHGNYTLDHTKGQHNYEDNWIMDSQGRWFRVQKTVALNLMIRAYAEGENIPATDAGLTNLDGADVIWQNNASNYQAVLTNYGADAINTVSLSFLSDGNVFDTQQLSGLNIAHNDRMTVQISDVKYPDEGNHRLSFRIDGINGEADSDPSDNLQEIDIFVVSQDAEPCKRNILFEEMTSELDREAPHANFVFNAAIESRREAQDLDDVIWVKHHVDGVGKRKDGNPWDTYAQNEDREYIRFYEGYPADGCDFTPAVTLDRNIINGMQETSGIAYFVQDEIELSGLFDICAMIPTYLEVCPTLDYNADTRRLDITIDAGTRLKQMIHQTCLHLTVYVVEDNLTSFLQRTNAETAEYLNADGTYTQNGVIRAYPAGVWGEEVEIIDNSIHREYSLTLPADWNPANMRVVAFVHNYEEDALRGNNTVYNAAQVRLSDLESIKTIPADRLTGTYYDLQGRATTHPSNGIYIIDGKKVVR